MVRIQGATVIARPVEDVFDFVADERNEPKYMPTATEEAARREDRHRITTILTRHSIRRAMERAWRSIINEQRLSGVASTAALVAQRVRTVVRMTETLLFHHAQGQTAGFLEFADQWRAAGHTVHAPDLYDGATFGTVDEGVAHAEFIGFDEIIRRATDIAATLPNRMVYAGFSLGAMPAQSLTQTRPGALGALLLQGAVPTASFSSPWPAGTPVQMHAMASDEWADVPVLEQLAREISGAELFLYPGSGHLFADTSSEDYDEQAAALLMQRTLEFLDRVG
jgi:dienelactone hydrolase